MTNHLFVTCCVLIVTLLLFPLFSPLFYFVLFCFLSTSVISLLAALESSTPLTNRLTVTMRECNTMQHSPTPIVNTVSNSSNVNGGSNVNAAVVSAAAAAAAPPAQHHPHSNQPQGNQSSQDLGHEYLLEY